MSNEYAGYSLSAEKDGVRDPSRKGTAILALAPWEALHGALTVEDYLALGIRLSPARRTDERGRRGHYELPEGGVVAVTMEGGRVPIRAYVTRDGAAVEISLQEAEDLIDPAGAGRRAWRRRINRSALTATPFRFTFQTGDGYEADTIYDWRGQECVAACVRATERCVWLRAVTYAEAVELGIA